MRTQQQPAGAQPGKPRAGSAGAGNAQPGSARSWAWLGPLLAVVWVVYLVVPLREAAGAGSVAGRVAGITGLLGLASLFAWSFVRHWAGTMPRPRTATLIVAAELACVALIVLAAGQQGLIGLVLVSATLMMFASLRVGVPAVVALALALLVLPRTVPGWQPEDGLALTALLAGLAMYSFRRATERKRSLHRAHEEVAALAVAQERDRISRDMHDILGHSLTVVSVKGELAARLLRSDPHQDGATVPAPGVERAQTELTEIQALVRSALADMRGMVTDERQVTLPGELAAARAALDTAGIAADLPGAVDDVTHAYRDVFAWALREGTTNVLRHAAASRVVVTLAPDALVIDDDGRGAGGGAPAGSDDAQTALTGGNGLSGLTERARAVGLTVAVGPSPLGGLRLAVHAPTAAVTDPKGIA